jgi:uncharacterized protein
MKALSQTELFRAATVPIPETKLAITDAGTVQGYGSVFGVRDQHGDIVEPGAFAETIAAHKAAGTMPAMLWSHDQASPIGVWTEIAEDAKGLRIAGQINVETQKGKEARSLLKQGAVSGLSIGYLPRAGGAEVDRDGVRRLKAVDLWEVSIVTFPSNPAARVSGVKADSRADIERILREAGLPKAAATKLAAGGWPALAKPDSSEFDAFLKTIKAKTADLKKDFSTWN